MKQLTVVLMLCLWGSSLQGQEAIEVDQLRDGLVILSSPAGDADTRLWRTTAPAADWAASLDNRRVVLKTKVTGIYRFELIAVKVVNGAPKIMVSEVSVTVQGDGTDPVPPAPVPPKPTPPKPEPPPDDEILDNVPDPGGITVLIIEETADRGKQEMRKYLGVLTSTKIRKYLNEHCAKVSGQPNWRILDDDTDIAKLVKDFDDLHQLPRTSLPWLYISNRKKQRLSVPLPETVEETMLLLTRWGGE